jgi:hypothetical protein
MYNIVPLQDVIQFGPLVKTLGLVMLNRPQLLPSIFKQVDVGKKMLAFLWILKIHTSFTAFQNSSDWPGNWVFICIYSAFIQVGLGVILDWSGHFLMLGYYTFLCTFIDPAVKYLFISSII